MFLDSNTKEMGPNLRRYVRHNQQLAAVIEQLGGRTPRWRANFGGAERCSFHRLRELEEENRRLKQMYSDLSFIHEMMNEIVESDV